MSGRGAIPLLVGASHTGEIGEGLLAGQEPGAAAQLGGGALDRPPKKNAAVAAFAHTGPLPDIAGEVDKTQWCGAPSGTSRYLCFGATALSDGVLAGGGVLSPGVQTSASCGVPLGLCGEAPSDEGAVCDGFVESQAANGLGVLAGGVGH